MQTQRQREITEKSIEIISRKGIQGLTIKNLSKEIGISEPAIYRHFDSKTAILLAILNSFKDTSLMLAGMMHNNEDPAIEKISFMFSKMLDTFSSTPAIVSVFFSEEIFKNEEELKNKILEIQNINQLTIETIIAKGQAQKDVRSDIDINNLAVIIMGAFRLLVKRWDLNNYNFNLKAEGKSLIKSLKIVISST